MGFTVTYTDVPDSEHGDADTYDVLQSGVLKVTSARDGKIYYYVADLWKSLTADGDHAPGQMRGGPQPFID
jgi:hypothetical protein